MVLGGGILVTALTSDVDEVSEPGIRLVPATETTTDGRVVTVNQPYLPAACGSWTGGEQSGLSKVERDILPQDTQGARRLYRHESGKQLYCSIVLAGRDVTSIHRPEMCLPAQGWKIESEYVEQVPITSAKKGKLDVMRMNTVREREVAPGQRMRLHGVFAYWFVGKDRVTPHHLERIFWTTKDRVLHGTNHRWAYILIHTIIDPAEQHRAPQASADEAMDVVAGFIRDLYPELMVN